MPSPDYDADLYAWTQAQAEALGAKDWAALGCPGCSTVFLSSWPPLDRHSKMGYGKTSMGDAGV
jgi:hypothetical protein